MCFPTFIALLLHNLLGILHILSFHKSDKHVICDNGRHCKWLISQPFNFLIYGRSGWICGLLGKLCEAQNIQYTYGSGRLENRASLQSDIASFRPTHVFNAAGVTGRTNVDWCESHKVETIRTNVSSTMTLADVFGENNLVRINHATGCIFEYDEAHPLGWGIGFKEEDKPNFIGSFYSKTKARVGFL